MTVTVAVGFTVDVAVNPSERSVDGRTPSVGTTDTPHAQGHSVTNESRWV